MSDLEVPLIQGNSDYQLTSGELKYSIVCICVKHDVCSGQHQGRNQHTEIGEMWQDRGTLLEVADQPIEWH